MYNNTRIHIQNNMWMGAYWHTTVLPGTVLLLLLLHYNIANNNVNVQHRVMYTRERILSIYWYRVQYMWP